MLRYGHPLRSCLGVSLVTAYRVWVRSIIGCAGVGLARVFLLGMDTVPHGARVRAA